jgi:hypothetical protein
MNLARKMHLRLGGFLILSHLPFVDAPSPGFFPLAVDRTCHGAGDVINVEIEAWLRSPVPVA